MQWTNTHASFGAVAKFFHWSCAAAFIGAYLVVYYLIWFIDPDGSDFLPILNIHWVLGILVSTLVLPRVMWRLGSAQPDDVLGSRLEHSLAHLAHLGLYGLMILMPLTGYLGTSDATNFGFFTIPSFRDTDAFGTLSRYFGFSWESFEAPLDAVHHFIGKWIAWLIVVLHVAAALFHHLARRDQVLIRMLPNGFVRGRVTKDGVIT